MPVAVKGVVAEVERAIGVVNALFPDWKPTPLMLGYARAVAKCALEERENECPSS